MLFRSPLGAILAVAFLPFLALAQSGDLLVSSRFSNSVLRFDGSTGVSKDVFASRNGMSGTVGLTFAPNGDLFVGAALSNTVYRFNAAGQFQCTSGGGSLSNATGVLIDSQSRLLGAYSVSKRIQWYNLTTGGNLGSLAVTSSLNTPIGMTFDPEGNLLVGSFGTDSLLRYNLSTGAFLGTVVLGGSGGLDGTPQPRVLGVHGRHPLKGWTFPQRSGERSIMPT
ncbi:MAG: hypothetical protein K2Y21_14825 [Phycisphaerales bacterium]|nr:hypothetical protein [Phycisphaerales bacterium]